MAQKMDRDRTRELTELRARRRARARGTLGRTAGDTLSNPLLPPWLVPGAMESSAPLGYNMNEFNAMDAKKGPVAPLREYPPALGALGRL